MARTRSDFLSRGSHPAGEGDSEEDEGGDCLSPPPLSPRVPPPEQDTEGEAADSHLSDSEMVNG